MNLALGTASARLEKLEQVEPISGGMPAAGTSFERCRFVIARADCSARTIERRNCIARLPTTVTPSRDGPRVNQEIMVPRVRLVDERGEMVGVVTRNEALHRATEAGLDLVEVAANADPPVVKILDFGKFKYEEQKRRNEARKKQKIIEVKEIKLRPGIDDHDYDVKMRSMLKFIEEGDKVKVTMRFRGRELAHQELGMNVLMRVRDDLDKVAKIEQVPRMEGRQMTMVMSPK